MASDQKADGLGRRTARTLSAVLIGQVISICVTGITIILLARLLQPYLYGQYTFAFGYASFIDAVGGLGLGAYLSRYFAIWAFKGNAEQMMRVMSSALLIFLISAILITALAIMLSGYLANIIYAGLGIPEITLVTSSLMIFFVMAQSVEMHALIGLGKGAYSSLTSVFGNIVQLIASVGLFIYGFGVEGVLAGMLIGYITSASIGALFVYHSLSKHGRMHIVKPTIQELKETAKFAFPIGVNNMLNDGMQNFSILFLGLFVPEIFLGNYGAALKGLTAVILLHNSINNVLLPTFSTAGLTRAKESLHKVYNKVLSYSLVLIMPMLVYVAVFAMPAIYLFLSSSYSYAPTYLSLIVVGAMFSTVSLFISSLIVSRGLTLKVLKYNAVVVIVELCSIAILVPSLGTYGHNTAVIGAIISIFLIGSITAVILFVRGAKRLFGIKFDGGKVLRTFASNALLAVALGTTLFGLQHATAGSISNPVLAIELLFGIIVALAVYPPIVSFTRTLDKDDVASIKDATSQLPIISQSVKLYIGYAELFMG